MDTAVVIAALILNPIARRKRTTETFGPLEVAEGPTILSSGSGGPNSPEKSDFESGGGPVVNENLAWMCDSRQDLVP